MRRKGGGGGWRGWRAHDRNVLGLEAGVGNDEARLRQRRPQKLRPRVGSLRGLRLGDRGRVSEADQRRAVILRKRQQGRLWVTSIPQSFHGRLG